MGTAIRKNNNWIEIDGDIMTLSQWCEEYGISVELALWRRKRGKSWEDCLRLPVRPKRTSKKKGPRTGDDGIR